MVRKVVVLTGGIGSGKSAAAEMFRDLGVSIVDADEIARRLTAPQGAALSEIRAAFGDQAIDASGAMDRVFMRERAFSDPQAKAKLEAILHPKVQAEAEAALAQAQGAYALYVVPLWLESSPRTLLGQMPLVVVVDCPPEVQIERVMQRSKLTRTQVESILKTQASREERLAIADHVLPNTEGLNELKKQVLSLHQRLNQP